MWYWWCQIKAWSRGNTGKMMVFKGKRISGHHHQWYRRMLVFTKQKKHFAYQRSLLWVVNGKQAWRRWQVPSCQEAWRVYTHLTGLQQGDWDLPVDLRDLLNISPRCMSLPHFFLFLKKSSVGLLQYCSCFMSCFLTTGHVGSYLPN